MKAAQSGNEAVVIKSLAEGANVNATDENDCTAFYYACQNGYFDMAHNLLKYRAATIRVGKPPLIAAVRNNHMECFKLLLKFKADVNVMSGDGETAFSVACRTNNITIAEHLLEYGANISVHSPTTMASILNNKLKNPAFFQLVLHCGLKMNLQDIVDSVLDEFNIKSEVNAVYNGRTALSIAAENGNVYLMQKLISLGVDLDGNNSELISPLSASCNYGNFDAVKCLLDAGAAVDKFDERGMTPLFYTIGTGRIDILKLLLDKGASVNAQDDCGYNPMMYGYYTNDGDYSGVMNLKMKKGSYIDDQNISYLFSAARSRHTYIKKLLSSHNDDQNISYLFSATESGHTAIKKPSSYLRINDETILGMACRFGHEKIVELLLTYKADPDLPNGRGVTPLSTACEIRHHGIVKLLLQNNANPNFCSNLGVSALAMACENSDEKTAQILFTFGADPFLQIGDGMSALEIACQNGLEKIIELFLKHNTCSILTRKQLTISSRALHIAAKGSHVSIVKMLLEIGADANFWQPPKFLESPLRHAVKNFFAVPDISTLSDVDDALSIRLHLVRLLLDFGAVENFSNCNSDNYSGKTLVCVAIKKLQICVFENCLLSRSLYSFGNVANITTRNVQELAPRIYSWYVQLIELLLNHDALLVCNPLPPCVSGIWSSCILVNALIPFDIGRESLIQLFQAGADAKFMSWAFSNFHKIISRQFNESSLNFFKALVLNGVKFKKNEFKYFKTICNVVPKELLMKAWSWYQEQQRNPLSLLQLSRIKIRKRMFIVNHSRSILSSINKLLLPEGMRLYLIFKGVHNEFDLDTQNTDR